MKTLTRRLFISNAAKVAALAAVPAMAKPHQYLLTLTDGCEGSILAQIGFSGDIVPIDPKEYVSSSRRWIVALVSGLPDGSEMLSEHFSGGLSRPNSLNFRLWSPIRRTKLNHGVEFEMLDKESWAYSKYVCRNGEVVETLT